LGGDRAGGGILRPAFEEDGPLASRSDPLCRAVPDKPNVPASREDGGSRLAVAIAVTRERRAGETRCAVTPEPVKKLIALGATVAIEAGTGAGSSIPDADYAAAGAIVAKDIKAVLAGADVLLKVRGPTAQET